MDNNHIPLSMEIQNLRTQSGHYCSPGRDEYKKRRKRMKELYGDTPVLWTSVMNFLVKSPDGRSEEEIFEEVRPDFPDASPSLLREALASYIRIGHVKFDEKNRKYRSSPSIVQPII